MPAVSDSWLPPVAPTPPRGQAPPLPGQLTPWRVSNELLARCCDGDIVLGCQAQRTVRCHWGTMALASDALARACMQGSLLAAGHGSHPSGDDATPSAPCLSNHAAAGGSYGRASSGRAQPSLALAAAALGASAASPAGIFLCDDLAEHWLHALHWLHPDLECPPPATCLETAPALALLLQKYQLYALQQPWNRFVRQLRAQDGRTAHFTWVLRNWPQLVQRGHAKTSHWSLRVEPLPLRATSSFALSSSSSLRDLKEQQQQQQQQQPITADPRNSAAAAPVRLLLLRRHAGWDAVGFGGPTQARFSIAVVPAAQQLPGSGAGNGFGGARQMQDHGAGASSHNRRAIQQAGGGPGAAGRRSGLVFRQEQPLSFRPKQAHGFSLVWGIPTSCLGPQGEVVLKAAVHVPWPRFERLRQLACQAVSIAAPALAEGGVPALSAEPSEAGYVFKWMDLAHRLVDEQLKSKCSEFLEANAVV